MKDMDDKEAIVEMINIGRGIRLSPICVADAAPLAALIQANIAHLGAFLPLVVTLASREVAQAHLEQAVSACQSGNLLEWHIFKDDLLCGSVRVKNVDLTNKTAEIGYFLAQSFEGNGIVTDAVRAVIAHCFARLGLNRFELKCAVGNAASVRVAERLGFLREGTQRQAQLLNGKFTDLHAYALLRMDFQKPPLCP